MATYHLPVLVWQDFAGGYSAALVEQDLVPQPVVAVDDTAPGAIEQIKSFLKWWCKDHSLAHAPDFDEPRLIQVAVPFRPEYEEDGRLYLCRDEIELRIPCVHGRQEGGLLICSLPTLLLQFGLHEGDKLRSIVVENVRQAFLHRTPQQLSRLLPPQQVRLEEVVLRLPRRRPCQPPEEILPVLREVAQPLADSAFRRLFFRPYERDAELRDLVGRLGEERANVALIGEHGVGKSTLLVAAVRGLERSGPAGKRPAGERERARAIAIGRLPPPACWPACSISVNGKSAASGWCDELSEIGGVLCVESLLDLVVQGDREAHGGMAAFFLPYLQSGDLRLVGEASPAEFAACRRLLPGFADVFQVLDVKALQGTRARDALAQLAATAGREAKIEVDDQAPAMACRLFGRFLPYQPLPGPAARFLTGLIDQARQDRRSRLAPADVTQRFIRQTGLPESLLCDEQPLNPAEVETALGAQVIGQPEACRAVARVITTFKAGLNAPQRPLGVLLFCGPTGVGKTELAKAASRYLFGHGQGGDRLLRLDMSEYALPGAAQRLIAKEDGTASDLIGRLRQQPFVVVLLDEIEKASPQVFDVLLGVFDEGRLTDRYGRTAHFGSAVVIMTSNLGAEGQKSIGFAAEPATSCARAVQSFFRPEFFNRLDAVVTFQPLGRDVCRAIVNKELRELAEREGLRKAGRRLRFTDRLLDHLVATGFDARFGARPLQRTIETRLVAKLSAFLLARPGLHDTELLVDLDATDTPVVKEAGDRRPYAMRPQERLL